MTIMKIAILAMNSKSDIHKNLSKIETAAKKTREKGYDFLCLPEMFAFIDRNESYFDCAQKNFDTIISTLKNLAVSQKINIFAGSIAEIDRESMEAKKVFNTFFFIDQQGLIRSKYRKIHLFELNNTNINGSLCEAKWCLPGQKLVSFEFNDWHIVPSICYDLRFPEIFVKISLIKKPLDLIFLPSAFTFKTGLAHWHTLVRARAIENQCYIIAVNQVGEHYFNHISYGHSLVVDPWGNIILDSKDQEGLFFCTIDKEFITETRSKIPIHLHRHKHLPL